jgi:aspartyl-tRNA(Asn)/glutamyl-tRNA(Gln) amidotransferase subunit A
MRSEDICWLTATALANAIRAGDVSSLDAVRAVLDRIDTVDTRLGAFATVPREAALQAAQDADGRRRRGETLGPLHGVPVSIKDIIYTKGLRTTGGSRLYENFVPDQDAIVVARVKAAGAVILGKTATPEFCHKTVTDSPLLGTTRNPWDTSRTTAGSSGGSAAAVAAGLGPLSIGTDGGGSIRLPAALCGVVGFKPSVGRVPQYPGFAGWDFLGHTGPLARTVEDVGLAIRVIAGPNGRDPSSLFAPAPPAFVEFRRLRVAFARSLNSLDPEPEVDAALATAVDAVLDLGLEPHAARVSWTDPDLLFRVIVTSELAAALGHHLPHDTDRMDPSLVTMLEFGGSRRATDLVLAFEWRRALTREVFAWFDDYDLMIVPAAPVTAFPLGMIGPTTISGRKTSPYEWFSWTWPFNLSGQPAISLPIWGQGDLPVGIQIVGRPGADELVLAFASALERQLGGPTARRPRLSDATRTAG